jgi:hypothetical protein
MESPWSRAWQGLPKEALAALRQEDLTEEDVDARIYGNMWKRHLLGKHTPIRDAQEKVHLFRLNAAGEDTSEPRNPTETEAGAIHKIFANLAEMGGVTSLYNKTPIGLKAWCSRQSKPTRAAPKPGITIKAIARYRHWKPRDSENLDNITQQEVDSALRAKWADRLLNSLRPHSLPYIMDNPQPEHQIRLLGKTKWSTIKTHALALEKLLRIFPDILIWKGGRTATERVQELLDHALQTKCRVSRLQSYWNTLQWVCPKMGYDPPSTREDLKSAYDHTCSQLSTCLYKEPHRAHMPPDEVVQALEKGATNEIRPPVYRYYASMLRTQLGVSARFVDMQHTAPSTHEEHRGHIGMAPWQTKTTHRGDSIKTKYVATKHSRTASPWWEAATTYCKQFSTAFPQMDFLYPKFDPTKTKFLLTPATYNNVQTMYKHILAVEGVGRQTVEKMTLHGLRLWAAEMAFQTQVPRDLRRYIGHWSQENTADTYTREHSSIITKIWTHIFDKYDTAKPRDQLSPDLSDPMYFPETGEPDATKHDSTPIEDKTPCSPPRTKQKLVAPATHAKIPQPKLAPDSKKKQKTGSSSAPKGAPPPANEDPEDEEIEFFEDARLPDIISHPRGPLSVYRGTTRTNGTFRLHYVLPNLCTIGCGKFAFPAKYMHIESKLDYSVLQDTQECGLCGKHSRVPDIWLGINGERGDIRTAKELDVSSDSDSSDTTDSEEESKAPVMCT